MAMVTSCRIWKCFGKLFPKPGVGKTYRWIGRSEKMIFGPRNLVEVIPLSVIRKTVGGKSVILFWTY